MSDTLDLDVILPEKRQVKFNGTMHDVLPATLKDFVTIQKLFLDLQKQTPENQYEIVGEINNVLEAVVPDIKQMNLNFEQLFALLKFVYSVSSISDNDTMSTVEKKMESVTQLATS